MKKHLLLLAMAFMVLASCAKSSPTPDDDNNNNPPAGQIDEKLLGIWKKSSLEKYTSGGYTGGYFWQEYRFNANGTYQYLVKVFSVFSSDIYFLYESGSWSVSGTQLTVNPTKGKDQAWSKSTNGATSEWGSLTTNSSRQLEKVTYTYGWKHWEGTGTTDLQLHYAQETVRDGTFSDAATQQWYYQSFANTYPSYMTLPPGFEW